MRHNYWKREEKIIVDGTYAQKNKSKQGNPEKK